MSKWDGKRIKEERKKRNWTQIKMAEVLGCRQQTVSEWEMGDYLPKNAYQKLLTHIFSDGQRQ